MIAAQLPPAGTCDTAATGCDPTDVDCDAFAGCYVSVGNEHDGIPRAELRGSERECVAAELAVYFQYIFLRIVFRKLRRRGQNLFLLFWCLLIIFLLGSY